MSENGFVLFLFFIFVSDITDFHVLALLVFSPSNSTYSQRCTVGFWSAWSCDHKVRIVLLFGWFGGSLVGCC